MTTSDEKRLEHIYDAICVIDEYVNEYGLDAKHNLDACIRYLMIIGEAANHLSLETKQATPHIEWPKIIGMRHFLIHEYHHVDYDLVRAVLQNEIIELKNAILQVIAP